jgi:hypothetical protein
VDFFKVNSLTVIMAVRDGEELYCTCDEVYYSQN